MLARLRSRLTFANVVSLLALFVALSGSAYAVTSLPKNSVGRTQLKRHAVTSSKVGIGFTVADNQALVTWYNGSNTVADTAFMIEAFC